MPRILTLAFACMIAFALARMALDIAFALPDVLAQAEAWKAAR